MKIHLLASVDQHEPAATTTIDERLERRQFTADLADGKDRPQRLWFTPKRWQHLLHGKDDRQTDDNRIGFNGCTTPLPDPRPWQELTSDPHFLRRPHDGITESRSITDERQRLAIYAQLSLNDNDSPKFGGTFGGTPLAGRRRHRRNNGGNTYHRLTNDATLAGRPRHRRTNDGGTILADAAAASPNNGLVEPTIL